MKTLLLLIVGIALGVGGYMYFKEPQNRAIIERTGDNISQGAEKVREGIADLDTEEIKAELKRSGRVIRTKAEKAGAVIKDATVDARITTSIKSAFALEPDLSALRISVNTTDGVVTLAGSASSAEDIKKAISIAFKTEGVTEVISTIQVKE